jgi:hypothetical protein
VIDADASNVDKLGQVVFVRPDSKKAIRNCGRKKSEWREEQDVHIVSVPGDYIKGAVVLFALEKFATKLVHDFPRVVFGDRVVRNRAQEVSSVGQSVGTDGSKFWQLKVGTPNLEDITSGWSFDIDLETLTSLYNTNLSWLDVQFSELGLNVQCALLSHNQEVTIRVDKSSVFHRDVSCEDMCCDTLPQSRVARSSNRAKTVHKVVFAFSNIKGQPGKLSWRDVDTRVHGEEVGFGVRVVRQIRLFGRARLDFCVHIVRGEGLRMVGFMLRQTYKPLVCDCWPRSVEPSIFVQMSWCNKC